MAVQIQPPSGRSLPPEPVVARPPVPLLPPLPSAGAPAEPPPEPLWPATPGLPPEADAPPEPRPLPLLPPVPRLPGDADDPHAAANMPMTKRPSGSQETDALDRMSPHYAGHGPFAVSFVGAPFRGRGAAPSGHGRRGSLGRDKFLRPTRMLRRSQVRLPTTTMSMGRLSGPPSRRPGRDRNFASHIVIRDLPRRPDRANRARAGVAATAPSATLPRLSCFRRAKNDLGSAAGLTDRIAVLHRGALVEVDSADAMLDRPRHPSTRLLVGSAPTLGRAAISRERRRQLRGELSAAGERLA
jgi:hypothetical protein